MVVAGLGGEIGGVDTVADGQDLGLSDGHSDFMGVEYGGQDVGRGGCKQSDKPCCMSTDGLLYTLTAFDLWPVLLHTSCSS